MICRECQAAASMLAEEKILVQHLDGRNQEMLSGADAARELHRQCRGGTWCACQHVVRPPQTPTKPLEHPENLSKTLSIT